MAFPKSERYEHIDKFLSNSRLNKKAILNYLTHSSIGNRAIMV